MFLGLLKDSSEFSLRLAVKFAHDLRAADVGKVCLRLVGNSPGNESFPGARRPMEEHPFGRLDPQPLEDLRVSQRELDHLPDSLNLGTQAPNIFIGNLDGLSGFSGLPGLQLHPGGGLDDHDPFGKSRYHMELAGLRADQARPNPVPFRKRQSGQKRTQVPLLNPGSPCEGQRAKEDFFGRLPFTLLDLDLLLQACLGIVSDKPVDLDDPLASIFRIRRHQFGHCAALALQLDEVSDDAPKPFHLLRIHPGNSTPHILWPGFFHTECYGPRLMNC